MLRIKGPPSPRYFRLPNRSLRQLNCTLRKRGAPALRLTCRRKSQAPKGNAPEQPSPANLSEEIVRLQEELRNAGTKIDAAFRGIKHPILDAIRDSEAAIDPLKTRLAELNGQISQILTRVQAQDEKVQGVNSQLETLQGQHQRVSEQLAALQEQIHQIPKGFRPETYLEMKSVYENLSRALLPFYQWLEIATLWAKRGVYADRILLGREETLEAFSFYNIVDEAKFILIAKGMFTFYMPLPHPRDISGVIPPFDIMQFSFAKMEKSLKEFSNLGIILSELLTLGVALLEIGDLEKAHEQMAGHRKFKSPLQREKWLEACQKALKRAMPFLGEKNPLKLNLEDAPGNPRTATIEGQKTHLGINWYNPPSHEKIGIPFVPARR